MKNISFFTHLHVCLFEKWVGHAAGTKRVPADSQRKARGRPLPLRPPDLQVTP